MIRRDNILITGFSGFVGRHFLQYLKENNIAANIYGIDIKSPLFNIEDYSSDDRTIKYYECNLLDLGQIRELFVEFKPDYILHLASFSSVAYSWKNPTDSFMNNTNIFLNLVTVVQEFNAKCRILSIGSSEEYGNVEQEDLPLTEESLLKPISPYAAARVSQEMLSKIFVDGYHLNIIMTRSFNHIGIWQDDRFVIPSFIKRIKQIKEKGLGSGVIETGDTSIIRDFIDVRDVVAAYYLLLKKGTSGEVYNICSGKGQTLLEVINMIGNCIGVKISTKINPDFIRPNDNKVIVGSSKKIQGELGWVPQYKIEDTLKNMMEYH